MKKSIWWRAGAYALYGLAIAEASASITAHYGFGLFGGVVGIAAASVWIARDAE